MNNFRTELNLSPSKARIRLTDSILTIGSCFSDAIGTQLILNKVKALVNPFGTIYNPFSIHKVIRHAISGSPISEDSFAQRQDSVLHYDFHSQFSAASEEDLKQTLHSALADTHNFLRNSKWMIITYGTAWVYELKETNSIVANCHKVPQGLFNKFLLTQKKILDSFETMYLDLKALNPDLQIILTVSPVRHLKESLELNSVSKSILRIACHTMAQQHPDVQYFPSYEIMLDDLRDYRFYKSDMIHPSEVGESYIWEKFIDRYFDEELKLFITKWKDITQALNHRPFNRGSAPHRKFVLETIKKLEELKHLVDVDKEIASLKNQ
jgi:GSCFA family